MTCKDYVALAEAIQLAYEYKSTLTSHEMALRIAGNIANVAAWDNPRFDRERFLKACGLSK